MKMRFSIIFGHIHDNDVAIKIKTQKDAATATSVPTSVILNHSTAKTSLIKTFKEDAALYTFTSFPSISKGWLVVLDMAALSDSKSFQIEPYPSERETKNRKYIYRREKKYPTAHKALALLRASYIFGSL